MCGCMLMMDEEWSLGAAAGGAGRIDSATRRILEVMYDIDRMIRGQSGEC